MSSSDNPTDIPDRQDSASSATTHWSRARLQAEVEILRKHLETLLRGRGGNDAGPRDADRKHLNVSVPEGFKEPFRNAQGYVERYFSGVVREPEQATISIAGERYILVRAASMSVEFVDLVASLYANRGEAEARRVADDLLFDFAHSVGKADALSFHEKMDVTDPIAKLSAGPIHFAYSGWAFVKILPESSPSADEDFFLIYDHPYSFESHAWMTKGRRSRQPVCVMNAGYSSGWCEESFGVPLVAAEVECVAAGDKQCRFIMAPPSRIEDHLTRHGYLAPGREERTGDEPGTRKTVAVPEFFQRRRWEEDLRAANAMLEERVDARTAELQEATQQLRLLGKAVEHADEGIVILSSQGDAALAIETVNQGFIKVSGIPGSEAVGRSLDILGVVSSDQQRLENLLGHISQGEPFETVVNATRPDGTEYTLEIHVMPAGGRQSDTRYWIGLFRDVTRRHQHLAELRRQATYDALTDLPNRVLLFERLEEAVRRTRTEGGTVGLLVIDLDGFKEVNDTFGHHAGDVLLEQVGPRLQSKVRGVDTVSRLGGDEFGVLLPEIGALANAVKQAEEILEALHDPFLVEGQELAIGASIGIVLCPKHGTDASTLLRRADVAMYVAKEARKGLEVYRSEDDTHSPERLALVGELRGGIERNELAVHYQAQVSLADRRPKSAEALVRWRHPKLGMLLPQEFVPYIELGNLVERLTDWVLQQAIRDCASWRANGSDIGISVNVAPRSFRNPEFPERVASFLKRGGLPPELLTLEVTEGGLLTDPEATLPVFQHLRTLGIRLAIDDFGTGYSSFAHLKELPIDEIKIDRTFVFNMIEDEQDSAIVRSTIQLGKSVGRTVVAEGVEDEAVMAELAALGCDYAQGYLVHAPLERERFVEWLAEQASP